MLSISHLNPRYGTIVSAILAGLTALTLIAAVIQWHADWQLAHAKPAITRQDNTPAAAELVASIPSEHLFGKSFDEGGDMPISNLQLKVTGIMKFTDDQGNDQSKATISIAGEASKIYQKGDTLPYGVKVYNITDEAVVLENDGHLEKLPLPRESLQFKPRDSEEN